MLTSETRLVNATMMDTKVDARSGEGDVGSAIPTSGDAIVVYVYIVIFIGSLVFEKDKNFLLLFVGLVCYGHETIFYFLLGPYVLSIR